MIVFNIKQYMFKTTGSFFPFPAVAGKHNEGNTVYVLIELSYLVPYYHSLYRKVEEIAHRGVIEGRNNRE